MKSVRENRSETHIPFSLWVGKQLMSQPIVFDRRADADKAIWEKLDALTKALDSLAQDALRVKTV